MTSDYPGLAWIHIKKIDAYIRLGVYKEEQSLGHNISVNTSLLVPYKNTEDSLSNTVDYGYFIHELKKFLKTLPPIQLIEYLAEQIIWFIQDKFPKIKGCRLQIAKGFVPVEDFHGSVLFECLELFNT